MAFPKWRKAIHAGEFFYITHDSHDDVWKVVCFMFVPQGLKSEGLYRISGFSDSVEEVKMAFDKGVCSSGFACCSCFIDFCQLTTPRLTLRAFTCLHKTHRTLQINEKVTHLWRITVNLGVRIPPRHVALTQGFTVWTDRGDLRGDKPWMYSHCLRHSCLKKLLRCVGIQ